MKALLIFAIFMASIAVGVGLVQVTGPAPSLAGKDGDKVTICHRDDNVKKPYGPKSIEIDIDGLNGHLDHTGPVPNNEAEAQTLKDAHISWGDIIPPVDGVTSGLNWTTEGQAIWHNDCQYVEVSPSPTTSTTPTVSPTVSPSTTATNTPESSPTVTVSPTVSPTSSASPSPSTTPTEPPSPTSTPSGTVSPTPSATESPTVTATPPPASPTPSSTVVSSPTTSPSPTPSLSPSPTVTVSPTPTESPTVTATPFPTPTPIPSQTLTPAPTLTVEASVTASASPSPTPTASPAASTSTVTPTPSLGTSLVAPQVTPRPPTTGNKGPIDESPFSWSGLAILLLGVGVCVGAAVLSTRRSR